MTRSSRRRPEPRPASALRAWALLALAVLPALAGCIDAPDYPLAPPSGIITLRNSLADEAIEMFRIRASGTNEWKGYNYISLIPAAELAPGKDVDFHVPLGYIDVRVESDANRDWTYDSVLIEDGRTRILQVTE